MTLLKICFMVTSEIRYQFHNLIDKASDSEPDAVLQVLESSSVENKYTKEELDSF